MSRVIGILAHVDAGKTTLAEQILYRTNSIRTRGRVDHKNAFLDSHRIEKQRGITVFSGQAPFTYRNHQFYLLDTPGHVDFSAEMERSLCAMDCAVVVVSCVEGVQGHTKTIWELLRQNGIPALVFLNKTDRAGADCSRVMEEMQEQCSPGCILFSGQSARGIYDDVLAERLAEKDDLLLEHYLEKGYCKELWLDQTRAMVMGRGLFPCFCGSALLDEGVEALLEALDTLVAEKQLEKTEPFSGNVYQIRHDRNETKLAFLRVISGTLRVKEEVCVREEKGVPVFEKVNELRQYSGEKFVSIQQAQAGDLCAAAGLTSVRSGDRIGKQPSAVTRSIQPLLTARVLFDPTVAISKVLHAFHLLEEEEPELFMVWEEEIAELHVHVMGQIQLEVLRETVQERFGFSVEFGPCEIVYRETIASTVIGYGHFEPLRHYAEVHLKLEPGARGSGVSFSSACPTDLLNANYQNLIRKHVFEKEHFGILTGFPLTDVKITLLIGKAHNKHTEGGDFREAVRRAVRQGLEQAKNVLLEPYYAFTITAPSDAVGRVLSDVQRLHGTFEPPLTQGGRVSVIGRGPVSEFMDYYGELTAATRGAAAISLRFDGYEACHNAPEVAKARGYKKDHDTENPSYSVFCSHGAGFPVKWNEVERYVHCK